MTLLWWHWVALGLCLAAAEMLVPGGFYFLAIGVAALVVGALLGSGLSMALWAQVTLAALLAFVLLAFAVGPLQRWLATRNTPCRDDGLDIVGEVATATVDIESDAVGQAELRGTVWTARAAGVAVSKGQRCRVLRCEGLTLWVQPE